MADPWAAQVPWTLEERSSTAVVVGTGLEADSVHFVGANFAQEANFAQALGSSKQEEAAGQPEVVVAVTLASTCLHLVVVAVVETLVVASVPKMVEVDAAALHSKAEVEVVQASDSGGSEMEVAASWVTLTEAVVP